jgi:hypothetical protein
VLRARGTSQTQLSRHYSKLAQRRAVLKEAAEDAARVVRSYLAAGTREHEKLGQPGPEEGPRPEGVEEAAGRTAPASPARSASEGTSGRLTR